MKEGVMIRNDDDIVTSGNIMIRNDDDIVEDIDNLNNTPGQQKPFEMVQSQRADNSYNDNIQHAFRRKTYTTYFNIFQWLLLFYCVISVTYLLSRPSVQSCNCSDSLVTADAKKQKSLSPTKQPTFVPTSQPTKSPTFDPSINPSYYPTLYPSPNPTKMPTLIPTYFDGYYAGDYKISAQNQSHGQWLLCDGSMYNISDYIELFDVIGHSFNLQNVSQNVSLFSLPNARDKVIGMHGIAHANGEVVGSESITMTEDNLPPHWHYISNGDWGTGTYDVQNHAYLSYYIPNDGSNQVQPDHAYILMGTNTVANNYQSSTVGNGNIISNVQPTIFMGNVFIHT
eukprot:222241_1